MIFRYFGPIANRIELRTLLLVLVFNFAANSGISTAQQVSKLDAKTRQAFDLDKFYQKHVDVDGFPVVGSNKVSDEALLEAAWIVRKMLGPRPDILKAMAENKTRLAVMAFNEYTTDIPEHRKLSPRVYWDRRARGLGATRSAPAVSCAEENLLGFPGDPYSTENICIHEFAHAIHSMGLSEVDPTFDQRLKQSYKDAIAAGLWKDTYAATNHMEYWAEGVQSWFDDNRQNDALHNHVDTRTELIKYDAKLARLCKDVFGDGDWRYRKPAARPKNERKHLAGLSTKLPRFRWKDEKIPERPKVLIQTTLGDIELELDYKRAPKTVANFLFYVHQGLYSDGSFHRTVTMKNQLNNDIKIEVIQAAANPNMSKSFAEPIDLERTNKTGLKHLDGTISMARDRSPNSAKDHFFICIGDQPELDFGGKRNSDGQGFAAFGKVTKGMEVVKKIHSSKSDGQSLKPRIKIQRAIRLN